MRSYPKNRPAALMIVASLLLAALAVPAQAGGGGKTRRVSGTYVVPFLQVIGCSETESKGCVRFMPKANERFIHVEVEDATGTAVYAYVNQDVNGDGHSDIDGAICGRTESPLRIVPEVPVNVFVLSAYPIHCPTGVASNGTIEATFGSSHGAVQEAASELQTPGPGPAAR